MQKPHIWLVIIAMIVWSSCRPTTYLSRKETRTLNTMLEANDMNHHMGFLLQELSSGTVLRSINADQYFTPASNTKVPTLATGLAVLRDSIPFIDYYSIADTLYVRGLGDPTFLHRDYDSEHNLEFLKSYQKIVLDQSNFQEERYGRGWSWDDFNGAYQVERSAFPIYGNTLLFEDDIPDLDYFKNEVIYQKTDEQLNVQRYRRSNRYIVSGSKRKNATKMMPLVISDSLVMDLLQDTLRVPVVQGLFDDTKMFNTRYSHPVDSLFTPMMVRSDNFMADQILLMASQKRLGYMNESDVINLAKDELITSPDELLWFDGCGLSRYNQFTPRSMVALFQQMAEQHGAKRIISILPQGGTSGTIKQWYGGSNGSAFVYAKTGTLRNVHCLSGYIKSESGRWYVFSFMHNNFPQGSTSVKKPMEKILDFLKNSL